MYEVGVGVRTTMSAESKWLLWTSGRNIEKNYSNVHVSLIKKTPQPCSLVFPSIVLLLIIISTLIHQTGRTTQQMEDGQRIVLRLITNRVKMRIKFINRVISFQQKTFNKRYFRIIDRQVHPEHIGEQNILRA